MRRCKPVSKFQGQVHYVRGLVLGILVTVLELLSEYEAAEEEFWTQSKL